MNRAFDAELDWGERGVDHLAGRADVLVIVDVLSFSTAVDVAVARGATVVPGDAPFGVTRAVHRFDVFTNEPYSLSPLSLLGIPAGTRLALPSPNGSALSHRAADVGFDAIYAGCLRNASAVGAAARRRGGVLGVIAAGERWNDGSLRPAIEDLLGAGAIVAASGPDGPSPDAALAAVSFGAVSSRLQEVLRDCHSGRELIDIGFAGDVDMAAELDVSAAVPVLVGGEFRCE